MFNLNTNAQSSALSANVQANNAVTTSLNDPTHSIGWRNASSGANAIWNLNGKEVTSANFTDSVTDLNWDIKSAADFNSDGNTDLVWRNASTGELAIWYTNSDGSVKSAGVLNTNPGTAWDGGIAGDFNGDGSNDLFFYNQSTGETAAWFFNGVERFAPITAQFGNSFGGEFKALGAADFNNDGTSDVVWQNQTGNREAVVWYMSGANATGATVLDTSVGGVDAVSGEWSIVGTGDFNADGNADILWRNADTTGLASWDLNGAGEVLGSTQVLESFSPEWNPVASFAPAAQLEAAAINTPRQLIQFNVGSDVAGYANNVDALNFAIAIASRAEIALAGVISNAPDVLQIEVNTQTIGQVSDAFNDFFVDFAAA